MFVDLPLAELRHVRPRSKEPADFDAFWSTTLSEARRSESGPSVEPYGLDLASVDVFDVRFPGFGGEPIAGWLYLPRFGTPTVTVIQYVGYGVGRGYATDHLVWSSAGYAHLVVDNRGQGLVVNGSGVTPDSAAGLLPHVAGLMTRGVESPATYYYRRLFTDAVRAVDFVRSHELLSQTRIVVHGGSQGGGIALAVAGLVPGLAGVLPDVPFLCDIPRALELTDTDPYREVVDYCRINHGCIETVFATLGYFDGTSFAARATARSLFSVALRDDVCPPSTVFAAYNRYAGSKAIEIYPFNGHEGGGPYHLRRQLDFVRALATGC